MSHCVPPRGNLESGQADAAQASEDHEAAGEPL